MSLLAVLFAILTLVGFCGGAVFGGRIGRMMIKEYKWTPMVTAGVILVGMGVIAVMTGGQVSEPIRAVLATVLGFAGGLVVVSRENFYR